MNRRHFLRSTLAGFGVLTTSTALGMQLQLANLLAAGRFNDYKAIVCIFLYGGNDSFNLLIPTDASEYNEYAQTRQSLAVSRAQLLSLNQTDALPLGMPTAAAPLADLFNSRRLALVANVGPMVEPLTKAEIIRGNAALPPQLFSHNDQQLLWQHGTADKRIMTGWGGRMADLLLDTSSSLPPSFTFSNTNPFQNGLISQAYVMNLDGPEAFAGLDEQQSWNAARIEHHLRILDAADNVFSREYARKIRNVRANNRLLVDALALASAPTVQYPANNPLGAQLAAIGRLMSINSQLNQPRQIYFASMGGFDTHDRQAELLPALQRQLAEAMAAFDADLQARNLSEQVVTFTQSEFGRTLTSNGDGTDHGWAGHQLVMGGGVNGGRIFGHLPAQALNTDDDLGDGRMIPTISLEQFGAQLCQWFGLTESEVNDIFPRLGRFGSSGFSLFL